MKHLILAAALASAPLPVAAAPTAHAVVGMLMERYLQAWHHADSKALGSAYAADGEFINPTGDRFVGPDAIAGFYASAFSHGYAGRPASAEIQAAGFATADNVSGSGTWTIHAAGGAPAECGTFDVRARRQASDWTVTYLHEIGAPCATALVE